MMKVVVGGEEYKAEDDDWRKFSTYCPEVVVLSLACKTLRFTDRVFTSDTPIFVAFQRVTINNGSTSISHPHKFVTYLCPHCA